jgi:hypothetical protein
MTVTLKNGGAGPIDLGAITSSDMAFQVDLTGTNLSLPAGMSTTFGVKFAPMSEGMLMGKISLTLKNQVTPIASVSVAGQGVVVMPRSGGCSVSGRAWPLALAPLFALALLALALRRRNSL